MNLTGTVVGEPSELGPGGGDREVGKGWRGAAGGCQRQRTSPGRWLPHHGSQSPENTQALILKLLWLVSSHCFNCGNP